MKLWEYVDKILKDGTSIKGRVVEWFDGYALDGPDELVIGDCSYPEDIIKEIKIVRAQFNLGDFID